MAVGLAAWRLGAGRARKDDPVSPAAGVVLRVRRATRSAAGQVLAELHAEDPERMETGIATMERAVRVGDAASPPAPRVIGRVAGG